MKICILGYSGFLGSHLSNYLSKKFTIKKIDLRKLPQKNSDSFEKFLNEIIDLIDFNENIKSLNAKWVGLEKKWF